MTPFGLSHVLLFCFVVIVVGLLEVAYDPDEKLNHWIRVKFSKKKSYPELQNFKPYEPGDPVKAFPGFEMNPFKKYPRNSPCYCESGKKFKNCCLNSEPMAIPKGEAETARTLIAQLRNK